MFSIQIDGKQPRNVTMKDGDWVVDGDLVDWDIKEIEPGMFHILIKGRSYRAEVIKVDKEEKRLVIRLNDQEHELRIKDRFDILLEKLGMTNVGAKKLNKLLAPMPGLVLSVDVSAGQEVQKGDQLLILEAMKMENVIKSPGEGKVKSIEVGKGDAVEKGAVLILFE